MNKWQTWTKPQTWPGWVFLFAVIVLTFRLGTPGFWEPQEIDVANRALKFSGTTPAESGVKTPKLPDRTNEKSTDNPEEGVDKSAGAGPLPPSAQPVAAQDEEPEEQPAKPKSIAEQIAAKKAVRESPPPPFQEQVVKKSADLFGETTFGTRFGLLLIMLFGLAATMAMAYQAGGSLAAAWSGLLLLSAPLFFMQARQLTGGVGAVTGGALAFWLCIQFFLRKPHWAFVLSAAVLGLPGFAMLYVTSGLVGVFPVLIGAATFGWYSLRYTGRSSVARDWWRWAWWAILLLGTVLSVAALFSLLGLRTGNYGDLAFLGALEDSKYGEVLEGNKTWSAFLRGTLRIPGDGNLTTTSLFEDIAFGILPWVGLAPISFWGLLTFSKKPDSHAQGATVSSNYLPAFGAGLLMWAASAWLAATVASRLSAPVTYPALAALACASGCFLATLRDNHKTYVLPALFVLFSGGVVAKNFSGFPEKLLNITVANGTLKYPEGTKLHWVFFGLSLLAAALLTILLATGGAKIIPRSTELSDQPSGPKNLQLRRWLSFATWPALATLLCGFTLFGVQVWQPKLSEKLSSHDLFARLDSMRENEPLALVGGLGTGPELYAAQSGTFEKVPGVTQLGNFLKKPERVFAIMRAQDLCNLHKSMPNGGYSYVVLDDENAQFLLISNKLGAGQADQNPLAEAIVRTEPAFIKVRSDYVFDNSLAFIGYNMPKSVSRGEKFYVTFFYKVLKPMSKNWKVFVHFDGSSRFQGDHSPIRERCGTSLFSVGDYVVDTFEVTAGSWSRTSKGRYDVFIGFFTGSAGNYTNMKVSQGQADENNRIKLTTIEVR